MPSNVRFGRYFNVKILLSTSNVLRNDSRLFRTFWKFLQRTFSTILQKIALEVSRNSQMFQKVWDSMEVPGWFQNIRPRSGTFQCDLSEYKHGALSRKVQSGFMLELTSLYFQFLSQLLQLFRDLVIQFMIQSNTIPTCFADRRDRV